MLQDQQLVGGTGGIGGNSAPESGFFHRRRSFGFFPRNSESRSRSVFELTSFSYHVVFTLVANSAIYALHFCTVALLCLLNLNSLVTNSVTLFLFAPKGILCGHKKMVQWIKRKGLLVLTDALDHSSKGLYLKIVCFIT